MKTSVVIPFRDRGRDPLRVANLNRVVKQWQDYGFAPMIVSDGREGDAQFNRSAAYNVGYRHSDGAEAFIFAESDMLISPSQITEAVALCLEEPGLVIPFTDYRYMSIKDSLSIRGGDIPERFKPQWSMRDKRSIGAINVVSRDTMELIGQFDEKFEGNWYDDDAMKIAFEVCAGPTRWVDGSAYHLYHLPGHRGHHLTPEDRAATARNRSRLSYYQQCASTGGRKAERLIRDLTSGRR